VSNAFFAKFIVDDAESIDKECDLLPFIAINCGNAINKT
jgi:hypothetical protein